MNALARIADNLASVGLTMRDVLTLRVYMDNAPGAPTMDFAGFNRAYRQFFANVNLHTGAVLPQRRGTGEPAPPLVVNPVRPVAHRFGGGRPARRGLARRDRGGREAPFRQTGPPRRLSLAKLAAARWDSRAVKGDGL